MAVPAILAVRVEGLVAAAVVEEEVEPTCETEGLVAVEEAEILVAKTRIQTEAGAARTRTAGVMLVQLLVSSSTTSKNWEST